MKLKFTELCSYTLSPSTPSKGSMIPFKRNLAVFKKSLISSVLGVVLEPMVFFLVFAFGVGYFVQMDKAYIHFLIPGYLCFCGFNISFIEASFGTYNRQKSRGVYETLQLAPISQTDLAFGEIFWATFKGFICQISLLVIFLLYSGAYQWTLFISLMVMLGASWLGAILGLLSLSLTPEIRNVTYIQAVFILPLSALAGVFFPLESLPQSVQTALYISPFTVASKLSHRVFENQMDSRFYLYAAFFFAVLFLVTNMATAFFKKSLNSLTLLRD